MLHPNLFQLFQPICGVKPSPLSKPSTATVKKRTPIIFVSISILILINIEWRYERSITEGFHHCITEFGLEGFKIFIVFDVRVTSIAHDYEGNLFIFVGPSAGSCWAVMTETVGHLVAWAGSIEAIWPCVFVVKACYNCSELLNQSSRDGPDLFRKLSFIQKDPHKANQVRSSRKVSRMSGNSIEKVGQSLMSFSSYNSLSDF